MASHVEKANVYSVFTRLGLWLQRKGDFVRCVKENQQLEYRFTSGVNRVIRIAAPAKEGDQKAKVDEVGVVFVRSPSKSTSYAVRQSNMSHATQHKILSKIISCNI